MLNILRQYKTESRNIALLVLLFLAWPYLPQALAFMASFTGRMIIMAIVAGYVLGMSLKVYYRILVMRIGQE
ncbi:hypothetical protein [Chitinophaga vietnamensis]|uniref:hypothetical protein n=1 Tax=Chitinophaga vietnamensis TaxID=2593957 RepID=UPI00117782B3|nr:hypothetical protein [Chitinophaga vietnamensis]